MTEATKAELQEWRDEAEEWAGTYINPPNGVDALADEFETCFLHGVAAGRAERDEEIEQLKMEIASLTQQVRTAFERKPT